MSHIAKEVGELTDDELLTELVRPGSLTSDWHAQVLKETLYRIFVMLKEQQ
jgi:hypothetical protein